MLTPSCTARSRSSRVLRVEERSTIVLTCCSAHVRSSQQHVSSTLAAPRYPHAQQQVGVRESAHPSLFHAVPRDRHAVRASDLVHRHAVRLRNAHVRLHTAR
eukprot:3362425-Rhodomonas_salina.2